MPPVTNHEQMLKSLVPFISRIAHRVCRNHHDAEEIIQEALIRMWKKDQVVDLPRRVRLTWLRKVVTNLSIDRHRRAQAGTRRFEFLSLEGTVLHCDLLDGTVPQIPAPDNTEEPVDSKLTERAILRTLKAIPESHRQPLMMVAEGMTYFEIADVLDLPVGTVKSRIFHGRKKAEQLLQAYRA